MKLYVSPGSPYGRIARVLLREKEVPVDEQMVDPWSDAPDLVAANPAVRVPTLTLDDGRALTESLLIAVWLETAHPRPALFGGGDATTVLAQAGTAMGAIDAAVAVVSARRTVNPDYDALPVGQRRIRTMVESLKRLNAEPPRYDGAVPTLAVVAAVVAVDYIRFRFPNATWMPSIDRLDALLAATASRASIADTRPR